MDYRFSRYIEIYLKRSTLVVRRMDKVVQVLLALTNWIMIYVVESGNIKPLNKRA